MESMHHYPDGRRHRWGVVLEKGRLPIPVVYRWLQPWMDLQEGESELSITHRTPARMDCDVGHEASGQSRQIVPAFSEKDLGSV